MGDDDVAIDVLAWQGDACVGVVVEAGDRARALVGLRVLAGTADACGECEVCRAGGASVCAFAKPRQRGNRTTAMARWLVALQDGIELPAPAAAAVPGDIALAYTAYARTSVSPADAVVLVGKSPVTRFLVEILRAKAITPTVVVEDDDDATWSAWLLAKGVAVAPLASRSDAAAPHAERSFQIVKDIVGAQGRGMRPTRVIATSGDAAELACLLAHRRGTLTLLPTALPGLDIGLAAIREVTVIGVAREHPDLIVEVAAMCAKGEIDLAAGTATKSGDPTISYVTVP
jgi:threonine dehydrogenase-like Zn-dependent dehydrogenase